MKKETSTLPLHPPSPDFLAQGQPALPASALETEPVREILLLFLRSCQFKQLVIITISFKTHSKIRSRHSVNIGQI